MKEKGCSSSRLGGVQLQIRFRRHFGLSGQNANLSAVEVSFRVVHEEIKKGGSCIGGLYTDV